LDYRKIRPYLKPDGIRRNIGLKFNAVTGDVQLHEKAVWDPAVARERARVHGADFIRFQVEELQRLQSSTETTPLLLCPYDTELFGHWWYEGVWFLEAVFDAAATRNSYSRSNSDDHSILTTPGSFIDSNPVQSHAQPLESSWGEDACHRVWLNETNQHFWRYLHEMEERMIALNAKQPDPSAAERRILDQMARELLLAQSSDWLFILTMETSTHYAERRFRDHVHRFFALENALSAPASFDSDDLSRVEREDCIFPNISYTVYSND
jgi:1,4-alpha-glucan branching enzyme